MGYSPWGQKESDTNEQLTFSLSYNVITATAGQSSVVIRGKAVRGKKGPMTLFQGDTVHKDVWEEKALMDRMGAGCGRMGATNRHENEIQMKAGRVLGVCRTWRKKDPVHTHSS